MLYKYQYQTEEQKQEIILANKNKRLVEEQNITEGNFLLFTDAQVNSIEDRLINIESTLDLLLLKQEGIL